MPGCLWITIALINFFKMWSRPLLFKDQPGAAFLDKHFRTVNRSESFVFTDY
jgi:hypothetical protein